MHRLQVRLDFRDERVVFRLGEEDLLRVHGEGGGPLGLVLVLGDQVEVHVAAGVPIGPVVDLVRVEGGVEGLGHPVHVGEEGAALLAGELRHVAGVLLVGHDAAAGVALLLKEDQNAGLQVADVDAEAVQQLLFPGAVSAVLVFHEGIDPFCLDCPTIIARRDGAW